MKNKININVIMIAFFRMYKMLGSISILALNILILYSLISYWDMNIQVRLTIFLIVIGLWSLIELTNAICEYFINKFRSKNGENNYEND